MNEINYSIFIYHLLQCFIFKVQKYLYEKEVLVRIASSTIFAKKFWISNTYSRKKY